MERDSKTLFCGNLAEGVTEELLYELFLQAGPVEEVKIPKDKNGKSRGFGFITFKHDISVPYALELMAGESLFGRAMRMQGRGNTPKSPVVNHNGHQKSNTCPPGFNFDITSNRCSPNYGGAGGGSNNGSPNNRPADMRNSGMRFPQLINSPSTPNGIHPPAWFPNYMSPPPPPPPPPNFMNPAMFNREMEQRLSAQLQSLRQMQGQYAQEMQRDKLRYNNVIQQCWPTPRR